MKFFIDNARHIVCLPFSIDNLHLMAAELGIERRWFHSHPRHPHYDAPARRLEELKLRCELVSTRTILAIINGTYVE